MRATATSNLMALIVVLTACAPAASRAPSDAPGGAQAPAAPKSLTIALQNEPRALMTIMGGDAGGGPAAQMRLAIHQQLAMYDDRGQPYAMLATELPSQSKGTWVLRPDGSMQTTYKLRPDVYWHDGTPLTAGDFTFAYAVTMDPELPIMSRTVANQIARIDAPDDATIVVDWSRPYPLADVISQQDLGPLPAHLLKSTYEADKEQFQRMTFWGRDFVGVGPYRVAEWELGSHVVVHAFDRLYGPRPKIDMLTFRFMPDESTVVANLLTGTVDGEFRSLDFNKVMFIKEEWERAGRRPLTVIQPTYWREMEVQYRPELTRPTEITDVRVRRALLQAIDRKTMADAIYFGHAPVADTFIPPDDIKWDSVKEAVVSYPYDPRRAVEALGAVGWRRGPDGNTLNAAGEHVVLPIWTTAGGQWEAEIAITADNWRSIGLGVDEYVIPGAQSRDRELRSRFPGFSSTPVPFDFVRQVTSFYGPECPTERTRWAGDNRGCYQNPTMDRIANGLLTTVDAAEQGRLWREMVRFQGEELPGLPLYFYVQGIIFREGVSGIKGENRPTISVTWNVTEWDVK